MAELLLELFSEEIPARMQEQAANTLKQAVLEKLDGLAIGYTNAESYVTPRRLVLVVDGITPIQPDSVVEKRGPRTDAPQGAIDGFLRSANLSLPQLEKRMTDKGEFYFAVTQQKGANTADILSPLLQEVLEQFTWPKSMRWGTNTIRWVRPLQNILCLFDGTVLTLQFGGLTANRLSFGHRFLSPNSFEVRYFADYRKALKERHVILDREERKEIILRDARALAEQSGFILKEDPELLEEVAGLIEWPHVLIGHMDEHFLQVPREVLTTAMRTHQKYFSVLKADGSLAPHFIVVANMVPKDGGKAIIAGNERVLRARLSDARFFWDQDRKRTLESRVTDLDKITFHAKLGTIGDKARRIAELATYIAVWVPHAGLRLVERASLLAKADLVSEMVSEFPELQGLMGGYYAKHDNEDPEIAHAITDHYQPLGAGGEVPNRPVTIAVALADKIDSLTGLFAIDEKPTGSKDPFALRRASLGVIRIILENQLRLPLKLLFTKSIALYPSAVLKGDKDRPAVKQSQLVDELLAFFADRLKASLKAQAVRHDLITAVFNEGSEDDLFRLVERVMALQNFLSTPRGGQLLTAYKRAINIVTLEEKKDKTSYNKEPSKDKLIQKEEQQLLAAIERVKPDMADALKEDQFEHALTLLDILYEPIEQFFVHVTVNCDNSDIRRNRLMILAQVRQLLYGLANFETIAS